MVANNSIQKVQAFIYNKMFFVLCNSKNHAKKCYPSFTIVTNDNGLFLLTLKPTYGESLLLCWYYKTPDLSSANEARSTIPE